MNKTGNSDGITAVYTTAVYDVGNNTELEAVLTDQRALTIEFNKLLSNATETFAETDPLFNASFGELGSIRSVAIEVIPGNFSFFTKLNILQ